MNFHKKGLLSLALSGLTFLSSFGISSSLAMNDTCSVLDYLTRGVEQQHDTSSNWTFWSVFIVGSNIYHLYTCGQYAYKIYKFMQTPKKHLEFLGKVSDGSLSDPMYVQRQEGPLWGWIATIQGLIKKIKSDSSLSQKEIYSLTHNGASPSYFEFLRRKKSEYDDVQQENYDNLQVKDCTYLLDKILHAASAGTGDLYFFNAIDFYKHSNADDYKKIMELLINTFGPCFGITDPVTGTVDKTSHMVMLTDYDNNDKVLKFEDPYYLKKYEMKLDKFAELCPGGFTGNSMLAILEGGDKRVLMIIGFTDDASRSGFYEINREGDSFRLEKKHN